ncbi:MAG: D-alanyl-D-alanine carboxypeptidase family protein, partial [Bacilli bacterium]
KHNIKKTKRNNYILKFNGKYDCNKIIIIESDKIEISEYKYYNLDSSHVNFSVIEGNVTYDYSKAKRFEIGTLDNDKQLSEYRIANIKDSYSTVINKKRRLSSDYIPKDLTQITVKSIHSGNNNLIRSDILPKIEQMFKDASNNGINLVVNYAYRSYDYQEKLFNEYVSQYGYETTIKMAAFAGASEHQTGLVLDIGSIESTSANLSVEFGSTKASAWLKDNAHNYGFILRFPKGKEEITTYIYEPWHYRYVGNDLAKYIYENNITLEELFDLTN